ncbi:DNA repair and recombination protein Rad26p [[Candida] railenensis]|uniref:DNA repair and recombination protein Rad26p n=1 Tax=[Candida] railenensis TaxID=45579 RepID=A0A9P0VYD3_9ASCO|nr:DNA repair and recombination protein Rad26p [[Candida] railenensis]
MSDLEALGVKLVDQDHLEQKITRQANQALISKDVELDEKRLEKSNKELAKIRSKIRVLQRRLDDSRTKLSQKKELREQIKWMEENELDPIKRDVDEISERLNESKAQAKEGIKNVKNNVVDGKLPDETERDYLIRIGKITAFGNENVFQVMGEQETGGSMSHVNLRAPGFANLHDGDTNKSVAEIEVKVEDEEEASRSSDIDDADADIQGDDMEDDDEYQVNDDGEDYNTDEEATDNIMDENDINSELEEEVGSERNVDDGDEQFYQKRLSRWVKSRSKDRKENESSEAEWFKPHPTISDAKLNDQFRLPGDIYPSLFDYQKTCVQWLWELYSQRNGGIIGDEMGLGKTVQVISFIAGLHYSGLLDKPVLVVVPATVLNQWVNEFHRWWPPLRCIILHSIGSGMSGKVQKSSEEQLEEYLEKLSPSEGKKKFGGIGSTNKRAVELIDRVFTSGHVIITTYVGLRIYSRQLLPRSWGYVVLDEGHKIRNPDSDISLTCKQLKTHNRIILSGTPIQNNLIELWSLFDFVFPGRLGTLPVFQQQFAIPINMGGYANASNVQVQTGYKCAVVLRDLISPYLLRRLKSDVAQDLPKKSEMVLFVKLTQVQQEMYEKFIHSEDLSAILKGKRNMLMGVDILRKICNHPDLVDRELLTRKKGYDYGNPVKSGKMLVLKNLLELWKDQGHRTLLFCQTKQMLDILQRFVIDLQLNYLRMDGSTPITNRQNLVDTFNEDISFHVFLLTTKVGGLGVNLTGADRVIIFDPDWNPSTDIQARERAWRLGQKKDITIYRLMTAGSIEEKIYHRQIFKTFLTNKILKDPKQRRFFKMNDLHDLFSLGDPDEIGTETGDLFDGSEQNFSGSLERKSGKLIKPKHKNDDDFYQVAGLNGVSKLDKFEGGDDEEDEEDGKGHGNDDSRIMEGLFSNSGVHSALMHDEIMDSSKHELSIVEREANKVAAQAAEVLKESRKLARKNKIGIPTWTGKFGLAGKFGNNRNTASKIVKPKVPPVRTIAGRDSRASSPLSSSDILNELRQKKGIDKFSFSKATSSSSLPLSSSIIDDKTATLKNITQYLNSKVDNFSTSRELMNELKLQMNEQKDMIVVRSMLREVANWDAGRKGWILKEDFKKDTSNDANS